MLLTDLANAFRKIEATTKRHQMTALLADLFRSGPEDAAILPYLLQGRLGPPYAAPDIGADEHRIAQAIAEATGVAEPEVWRLYRERGDLGLVAEELLPSTGQPITVRETSHQLRAIAIAAGAGAYEEKVRRLRDLLQRLSGPEARYLVRIAQGRLRLGVGDATVMDALSLACFPHPFPSPRREEGGQARGPAPTLPASSPLSRSAGEGVGGEDPRQRIERAYRFCSDLGLVAHTLCSGGPEALDQIRPAPGRPVLSALAERLPSPEEIIRKLRTVVAEPKYDGLRVQVHKDGERIWLFTRRLEDVTHAFPDVAQAARRQIRARQAILDGEAVGHDPRSGQFLPFQQTVRRRRKYGVEEMEILYPMRYYVFDLLYRDGRDLTPLPLGERLPQLREVVSAAPRGPIFITPEITTGDPAELQRFFDEMVAQGLEGILVKRPDAPYHAGARRFNWVKLKRGYQEALADTFDVVVVGYYRGRGKRAKLGIGAVLCAVLDPQRDRFRTVTRVGSGLTEEEWARLRGSLDTIRVPERPPRVDSTMEPDVWVVPQYVIEVIAGEITRSPRHTCGKVGKEPGYALRFPRMSRFRFDLRPEDATTETEVLDLFHLRTPRGEAA